ncbi:MAG: hypothetical protein RLZZ494_2246 [Pseudomonadota bacterium]|jgi:hypothetical protein
MVFLSAIGSVVSGVCSAVGSIGSALSSFAGGIATVLGTLAPVLGSMATTLSRFAAVLQVLGVFKPSEQPDEMGERALQAAGKGITIDQFEDFDSYLDALRDFDLDPEKAAKRSYAEKLVAGLGVGTVGLERKFNAPPGSLDTLWLLPITNPAYFTVERMQSIISTGRLGGDVWAYLDKRLSAGDSSRLEDALTVASDRTAPTPAERNALYDALDQARDRWAELGKQVESSGKGA